MENPLINLFSDTATQPTKAMREAMVLAKVGDEQRGEDPTTLKLEKMMADLFGFSSALFFPSATMANEIAIRLHCQPGDELIAADTCHLFCAEAGGPAALNQVMCKPIKTKTGIFSGEDIRQHFNTVNSPYIPISRLVSIENTSNLGGGVAWTSEQLKDVVQTAKSFKLKLHLDGARLFNAVIKTQLSPKEITAGFDTVTICLSKGLGCPVGAILLFDESYFVKVRRFKQLFGGAMRQTGILAAAGIYALEHHVERLQVDHDHATLFAQLLKENIPEIRLITESPDTNMVFFEWQSELFSAELFWERCKQSGLQFSYFGKNKFRAVTHLDITRDDIIRAVEILKEIKA